MIRRLTFRAERCLACRSCEVACVIAHSDGGTLEAALAAAAPPRRRVSLVAGPGGPMALRCEQCDDPLCVLACKSGALHQDLATGRLVFDESRCVSCTMCLMVCARGVRLDPARRCVVRCDTCLDAERPACVTACPTRALSVQESEPPQVVSDFSGHLVVVGSSAAGVAACEAARTHAPRCRITMVTADARPLVSRPLLSYVLSRVIDGDRLDWRPTDYLTRTLGVEVLSEARAAALDAPTRRLHLADGHSLAYDRLVLAVGARAVRLDVPGADLPGVLALRDVSDLEALLARAVPGARAVVVGGGNVGLQVCEGLLARGLNVTTVVRSPYLLSQSVDEEAGRRVGALFQRHGLALRTGRDVETMIGNGRLEGMRLDDGETLPADLVVVGKGIVPNVAWLAASGIDVGRGVRVDAYGRTNVAEVYAAGDCAESIDPLSGESAVSGVWPVAMEMGRTAGSSAVGVPRSSPGALRLNAMTFFETPIISIGEPRERRVAGACVRVLARREDAYRKLVLRDGRLAGALLYGDVSGAGAFYRLYRDQAPIEEETLTLASVGVHP